MQSKIEDTIRDIEDYIEGCKGNMFNPNKITIDKEEFLELIEELKANAPAIHMLMTNVETEVNPTIGGESASEDIINFLLDGFDGEQLRVARTEAHQGDMSLTM